MDYRPVAGVAQVKVFRNVLYVRSRSTYPVPTRYRVELVARGTGTQMYVSAVKNTVGEAQALATRYLEKAKHLTEVACST